MTTPDFFIFAGGMFAGCVLTVAALVVYDWWDEEDSFDGY